MIVAALLLAATCSAASVRSLVAELPSARVERKLEIVHELRRAGKAEAVPALMAALDLRGGSPKLSLAIVRALGELRDRRAEDALSAAWDYLNSLRLQLGDDLPADLAALKAGVAEALGEVGGDRARGILLEALGDHDPAVQARAALGLGRLHEASSVEPLLELISRRGSSGQAAFEALAELGDPRAVPRVEAAAKSDDPILQAEASYALARLERPRQAGVANLISLLDNDGLDPAARCLAAYYLIRLDESAGLDFLARVLRKGRAAEKVLAAQTLGKAPSPKATEPLVEALKASDKDLKLALVAALERRGDEKAIAALRRLQRDPYAAVQQAATLALARALSE